jgi:thioesterase domain-containing protein
MDDLAGKLAARGIQARVYSHADEDAVAVALVAQHGAGWRAPIALIGHSLGGGSAIVVAEQLGQAGIPVDLVVPIDPVSAPAVPANVRRVVNYYLPTAGMGQRLGAGPNFRGVLVNADLDSNRRDLGYGGLTHTTIDKSAAVHAEIIREVQALARAPRD